MKISEIAKLAGVSSATVSRYFNGGSISDEKKMKIKKIIDETGYVPNFAARSLRMQRVDSVGIIVPKINSDSVSNFVEGVFSVLNQSGYMALFANVENNENREIEYMNLMQERHLAGIILMGTIFTPRHNEFFKECKIPIVVCGQKHPDVTCVFHNDRGAGKAITKYMIEKGRKKFTLIGANENDISVGLNRRLGVEDALKEYGLNTEKLKRVQVGFTAEEGYRGMMEILENGYVPDAVVCATDTIAVGAIQALKNKGLNIPRDVSVGGIGGGKAGTIITPQLTTVKLFHRQSGIESAKLLLSMIERFSDKTDTSNPVTHTELGFSIIERESV